MSSRTGPTDPRLLHYTRATRRYLIATILLGGVTAGLVVAQAWLIATVISRVVEGHQSLAEVRSLLALLLVAIVCRAAVGWLGAWMADRASAAAKSDLRIALVERIALLGPGGIDRQKSGSLVVLATSGIDALDSYFARYLPQLFLAVIVPFRNDAPKVEFLDGRHVRVTCDGATDSIGFGHESSDTVNYRAIQN